ncbi:MAG: hypothetical protein MN733_31170 [Nitrososphaera sp.]|nr:hypothetical protein [Nitrososphaera sp.]
MITRYSENESVNSYPSSRWREAFGILEPMVGRSVSEVLVEDLCANGIDVIRGDSYVKVADVKKVLNWLFGDGSEIILEHLEKYMKASV